MKPQHNKVLMACFDLWLCLEDPAGGLKKT